MKYQLSPTISEKIKKYSDKRKVKVKKGQLAFRFLFCFVLLSVGCDLCLDLNLFVREANLNSEVRPFRFPFEKWCDLIELFEI